MLPNIAADMTIDIEKDLHSSDHYPIIIKYKDYHNQTFANNRRRWIEEKADWKNYSKEMNLDSSKLLGTVDEKLEKCVNEIIKTATNNIPQTTGKVPKKIVPWWNLEVANNIKERKKLLYKFKRMPSIENLTEFKKQRAKTKRSINMARKKTWENYVESIDNNETATNVWKKVNKIRGKYKSNLITSIDSNGQTISDPQAITDLMVETFANNSSNSRYHNRFLSIKTTAESINMIIPETNSDEINKPFTEFELNIALKHCKGKSPGPDNITYNMISNMDRHNKITLLHIFNEIWNKREHPTIWQMVHVIPIKKNNYNNTADNMRPISLSCCMSKILEKIIHYRLTWYIEKNNLLSNYQAGFRTGRSTNDHLIQLHSDLLIAINKGHHSVCIFFDLKKAYERLWKLKPIQKLIAWGIRRKHHTLYK